MWLYRRRERRERCTALLNLSATIEIVLKGLEEMGGG